MSWLETPYPRSLAIPVKQRRQSGLLSDPLARNGLALVSSAALSSILGLAYWVFAARLYSAQVLGINAVMISSMITLANLGQLNLGNFLTRTLAGTGSKAGHIVFISYLLALGSGAVFGIGFILVSRWLAPELSNAFSSPWVAAGYALCIVVWTIFNLQDSVLAGLRQSVWVPVENGLFSVAKLVLLAVFHDTPFEEFGPLLAWILPTFLLVPIVSILVALRFVPETAKTPATLQPKIREIAGMMGWDYLATIAMMIGLGAAPILVLQMVGPSAAAGYSITWAITYSIYLVARSFGISMMAEAAADPTKRKSLAARSLVLVAGLLMLVAVGIVVLAPYVLLVFGKDYANENVTLLRLLALSAIPWGLTTIYVALARSAGKTGRIAAIQIATVGLFFLVTAVFAPVYGVIGIGVAWLASHSLVLASIGIVESRNDTWRLKEFFLLSVSSAARLLSSLRSGRKDVEAALDPGEIEAAAEALSEPPGKLVARRVATFDNDCETLRIKGAGGAACAYLKRATTCGGQAALAHHVETVARLRGNIKDTPQSELLPEILADRHDPDRRFIIQRPASGIDGRKFLKNRRDRREPLTCAAAAMAVIHASNCRETVIADDWLGQWIEGPLADIASLPGRGRRSKRMDAALELIRQEQHAYWSGRKVFLGWHHGDFSPGNVFFENPADGAGLPQVSAIIDWDGATENGPVAVDAWHLSLTAESERREVELGIVLCGLLRHRAPPFGFRPDRDLPFPSSEPPQIVATLAWLRHVQNNLNKSARYRENVLWRIFNIEWVLDGFLTAGAWRREQ